MKRYNWEQDQIKHMKEYIARFGHGSAKLAKQAQSKEKTLAKMQRAGLTKKVRGLLFSLTSTLHPPPCTLHPKALWSSLLALLLPSGGRYNVQQERPHTLLCASLCLRAWVARNGVCLRCHVWLVACQWATHMHSSVLCIRTVDTIARIHPHTIFFHLGTCVFRQVVGLTLLVLCLGASLFPSSHRWCKTWRSQ